MKTCFLLIFLLTSFLVSSDEFFSAKERELLKYYESPQFFDDQRRVESRKNSQRFFKNQLNYFSKEDMKRVQHRIKKNPWLIVQRRDEFESLKRLVEKEITTGIYDE